MARVVMEIYSILYLSTTVYLHRGYSPRLGDDGAVGDFGVHLHIQRPPIGAKGITRTILGHHLWSSTQSSLIVVKLARWLGLALGR